MPTKKTKGEQKPAIDAADKVAPATDNTAAKQLDPFKWAKGQSGNIKGRPKGSRNRLAEDLVAAFSDDFREHGVQVIRDVRLDKPTEYLKIAVALIPKEFTIKPDSVDEWSDEQLLDAIRSVSVAIAEAETGSEVSVSGRKTKPH